MTLALTWERCVRTRSRAAQCHACVDACPVDAVSLQGPLGSVVVNLNRCIDCGSCQAACPTESFSGAVDVANAVETAGAALACTAERCLAALSVEDFLTLAIRHRALRVDASGCDRCRAAPRGQRAIRGRLEEARELLEAFGLEAELQISLGAASRAPPAPQPSASREASALPRRALFQMFVPGMQAELVRELALAPRGKVTLDPKRVRERPLPQRRARLLAALAQAQRRGGAGKLPASSVSIATDKVLNVDTCTACLQCVTSCPTEAITSTRLNDALRFEASRCVGCGTCHDVCEPRALTVAPRFDAAAFLAGGARTLGQLSVKQCGECGALFKYAGGEVQCPTCHAQEDDARALQGLPARNPPEAS